MRRLWPLAVGALVASIAPATHADTRAGGLPAWDRVPAASPGPAAAFHGVTAIGPGDVWAVGSARGKTLVEHSGGAAFATVPSPNVPDRTNVLENADGVAPDDVWAVGHADVTDFLGSRSLTVHWDGATWSRVPSPNQGTDEERNDLFDVTAISHHDAWAVGTFWGSTGGSARALTLHWDGSSWAAVPNSCGYSLEGVFALSASNVWAVGGQTSCRWNGTRWVAHPVATAPNGTGVRLFAVSGRSASDLWAVGSVPYSCGEGQICPAGAIEHWNGVKWSFVLSIGQALYGVAAISASNAYAVGVGVGQVIAHFNGTGWSEVPEPTPFVSGQLEDVDAASARDLWAVGLRYTGGGTATLGEHAPSATSGAVRGDTNVAGGTVSWFGPESGSVETSVFGRYGAGGLDAGTYTFTATLPGCTPDSSQVEVVAGATVARNFRLGC